MEKKKAVITILGIQNPKYNANGEPIVKNYKHQAKYYFSNDINIKHYYNTLPLLIDKYSSEYEIIPVYTEDAKIFNQDVLKYASQTCKFDDNVSKIDESEYFDIFNKIDKIIDKYDSVIVDLTHGFRHLPILTIIDLVIQNFSSTDKVEKILFAKEIVKHTPNDKGKYEIVDLKEYLDIANIAFILTTFEKNYTVANHIESKKYQSLVNALNNFSNDLMALSLNNLFKNSSKSLIKELNKINDIAINNEAKKLKEYIEILTDYKGKKRYQTYFDLSKELLEKNYLLLSLSLLFESIRMYIKSSIKSSIKKDCLEIVAKVEKELKNDLYKIADFFKNLSWKQYDKLSDKEKQIITENEYKELKNSYPSNIKNLYDNIDKMRNNLAHANADTKTFQTIKDDINKLLEKYEKLCIKDKNSTDLVNHFNNN